MFHCAFIFVVLILPFFPNTSFAEKIRVVDATFVKGFEKHELETNVSGNVIVGVMLENANTGLKENSLAIQLPSNDPESNFCLKVISRDGVYSSIKSYKTITKSKKIVRFPYKSKYQNIIDKFSKKEGDIALAVTSGACEDQLTKKYYLPAEFNQESKDFIDKDIYLFINGFDATEVAFQVFSSQKYGKSQECEYIEEGRHTAYNFICRIPERLVKKLDSLKINILREVFGRELSSISIEIMSNSYELK